MNFQAQIWLKQRALWVLALAIVGGSSCWSSAGEPIIFGKEKSKADPIKDTKFGKELSKPWENLPESTPFNDIIPPILPRQTPQDPKKDKKRKAELEEKRNWMLYESGELQEKVEEEEQFGVREYKLDESEKEDGSVRDLTFRKMDKNPGHSRSPGQSRTSAQRQKDNANQVAEQQREREEAEAETKRESRKLNLRGTGQRDAASISDGLEMKPLFDPGQVRDAENKDAPRINALNSGAAPALSREQQARREEFKTFLNGPSAGSLTPGSSEPVNPRIDFTRQPINPIFPKGPDPSFKTGGDPIAAGRAPSPYDNLPVDQYSRTPGFLPSQLLKPPEPSRASGSSFSMEPPKKIGRTLGGH